MTTQSFNITIDFSEALNLDSTQAVILDKSNITLTNATINESTIDNNGSDGKGRVVIEATITDLVGDQPTITISGDSYSDTLGNTGESDYVLTIPLTSIWLTAGTCENFSFDGTGDGSSGNPYQIFNICQLQNIAADDITAGGETYTNLLTQDYILIADIDASYTRNWDSGKGFNPIGDGTKQYAGTLMATAMLSIPLYQPP